MADPGGEERFCTVGEVRLCYQTFGEPHQPALLLIMGLGMQMLGWPEEFCATLAARGFHVIRFDNRDVGHSSRIAARPPSRWEILTRHPRTVAYTLGDMADDANGLLDHLEHETAHVVGVSLGGMIAQTLAARHPERVRSLVSVMSTTGGLFVGHPAPGVVPVFFARPVDGREAYIQRTLDLFAAVGSPGFERDEQHFRELAGRSFDRGLSLSGTGRQLAAVLAAGDRSAELRRITAPTLVIHGTADRMVSPSGGRATARTIPNARLMMIEGMGHDLPRGAWPQLIEAIAEHAQRATPDQVAADRV